MYSTRILLVTISMFFIAETILAANDCDDPNARMDFPGHCLNTCFFANEGTTEQRQSRCPAVTIPSCTCNPGYVYDPHVKKCVKPEDCSPEGLEDKAAY